jgi:capsule polysaccharide export protein KpsE/RkpR
MNDIKAAVNQLIEYAVQSDRRLTSAIDRLAQVQTQTLQLVEGMQTDIRDIRVDMREMQSQMHEMQSQMRGMQVEQGRILDYLFNQDQEN